MDTRIRLGKTPITLFKTPVMTATQINNKSKNYVAMTGDTVTTVNVEKTKPSCQLEFLQEKYHED